MNKIIILQPKKMPKIERTNEKSKKRKQRIILLSLLILLVISITIVTLLEKKLVPGMKILAENAAEMNVSAAVDEIVSSLLENDRIDVTELVKINFDDSGKITHLSLDAKKANKAKNTINSEISKKLAKGEKITLQVPIGSLFSSSVLSGRGHKIKIKIYPVSSAISDIQSEFVSTGINQVMHNVFVEVECNVTIVMKNETMNKKITQKIILSQNVIVGEVPNYFR